MTASHTVTGSLQNDKGTWVVRARVYDPISGKTKNRTKSTKLKVKDNTKRKAQEQMKQIIAKWETEANADVVIDDVFFSDYVQKWLDKKQISLKANTIKSYKSYNDLYVNPMLGDIKITDIKRSHIQTFCNKLSTMISASSVRKILVVVEGALKEAVFDGALDSDFKGLIELPKAKRFEGSSYSKTDFLKLLDAVHSVGEPMMSAVVLAGCYGLRRSEVVGLRWKDIDFEKSVLHVRNTVVQNGDLRIESETTKTSRSRRDIALIPYTIPYLKGLLDQQKSNGLQLDKVCRWSDGREVRSDFLIKKLHSIQDKCGLDRIRFHDLRGTAATLLESAGLNPKQIQAFLGHEDITTTLERYVHVLDSDKLETAERMNDILQESVFCSEISSE